MQKFPYALGVESLMYDKYAHVQILYTLFRMLGRYLSNYGMDHWKIVKQVMMYL